MNSSVKDATPISNKSQSIIRWLCSFSSLLLALFLTAVYVFCSHRTVLADPDIWWHLRNAKYLIQHHAFLRQDIYTFTIHGRSWVNPEWLAELPYYFAWLLAGYRGLYIVAVTLIEAVVAGCCLLGWQRTRNLRPAILASIAFVLLATVSIGPRTQMFGWLCLIAELFVLEAFSNGKDLLWALPPLFALWVNLHGSWPIGILFLFLYGICRWNAISWGAIYSESLTTNQRRRLALVAVSSVLALFVNPYGWRLVIYPLVITTRHPLTLSFVQEWQSLDFHSIRGHIFFAVLAALLCASMARRRRWELHDLVFMLTAVLAAITCSRFLLMAGIVLTPYLARELDLFEADDLKTNRPILNFAIICALLGFVISHVPGATELKEQSEHGYPAKATAYLRATPLEGSVLNDFNWGGYLEWYMPELPIFIDSRTDAFEQWGVFADYMDAVRLVRPNKVLDRYGVRRVLLPVNEPLLLLLKQTPGWVVEYEDETAVVLKRSAP